MVRPLCEANNAYTFAGLVSLSTGIFAERGQVSLSESHNWKALIVWTDDGINPVSVVLLHDRKVNPFNSINGTDANLNTRALRFVSHFPPPNTGRRFLRLRNNISYVTKRFTTSSNCKES